MGFRAWKGIDFSRTVGLFLESGANALALLLVGTGIRIASGNLVLTAGDITLTSGDLTLTDGDLVVTGGTTNGLRTNILIDATAAVSPTAAQSGTVFIATAATGAYAVTLPTGIKGLTYTFVTGHAGNEIAITGAGSEEIYALADDSGASIHDGVITNTGGTNILGDRVTLVYDGVGDWWAVS